MKLLTSKRGEYIQEILNLKPNKISTFSPINDSRLLGMPNIKLLIQTKSGSKQIKPTTWEIKTNNKIHAKIVIGEYGFYIRSWNLSINSTENMHEVGLIVPRFADPISYSKLINYFDILYKNSTLRQ